MPFAHCPTCAGPAVLDPTGRCPEGHLVGSSGARGAPATVSDEQRDGPSPDATIPRDLVGRPEPAHVASGAVRVARARSHGALDPDASPPVGGEDLLRELDDLGAPGRVPAAPCTPQDATDLDELASLAAAVRSLDDRADPGRHAAVASAATASPPVDDDHVSAGSDAPHRTPAQRDALARALAEVAAVMQPSAAPPDDAEGDPPGPAGGAVELLRAPVPTDTTEPISRVRRERQEAVPVAAAPSIEDELAAFTSRNTDTAGEASDGTGEAGDGTGEATAVTDATGEAPDVAGSTPPTPDAVPLPTLDGRNFTAKGGRVGPSVRGGRSPGGRRGWFRR